MCSAAEPSPCAGVTARACAGLKFFVLASKGTRDAQTALRDMYAAYTDYALKVRPLGARPCVGGAAPALTGVHRCCRPTQNPFYEVDMPIRCQLFDKSLERLVGSSLS